MIRPAWLRSWYYALLFRWDAWRSTRAFFREHGPIVSCEPMPRQPKPKQRRKP